MNKRQIEIMKNEIAAAERVHPEIAAAFARPSWTPEATGETVTDNCRDCGNVHHHPKAAWDAGDFFWRCRCGTKNHG